MGSRRQYIYDLPAKLTYLISTMPNGTRKELEDKAGILAVVFTQVNDDDDNNPAYSRLGPEHQKRLAAACGFKVDWPEWRDPERPDRDPAGRRDTTAAFVRKLGQVKAKLREAAEKAASDEVRARAAIEQQPDAGSARAIRRVDVRIAAGNDPKPESLTGDIPLGSVEMHATQWSIGSVLLSLTLSCLPWRGLGVQRASIRLDPGGGQLCEAEGQTWGKALVIAASHGNGVMTEVSVTRGSGGSRDPLWDVVSRRGHIGHFRTDGDFAPLEKLAPGDKVTVTLGTWVGDLGATGAGDGTDFAIDDLVLVDDGKLPEKAMVDPKGYKRRLIGIIRTSALNVGNTGNVALSRCTLEIVAA